MARTFRFPRPPALAFLLLFAVSSASAQTCNDPGAYCEGWSRDSTRREISLTRTTLCGLAQCPAVCSTQPITALPSIRIDSFNHVVLGFSVSNACDPECPSTGFEPCYNLGISYRHKVTGGSESVVSVYDCDPLGDPGTTVADGATLSGNSPPTASAKPSSVIRASLWLGTNCCGPGGGARRRRASPPGTTTR